ncbi:MAG: hypothetical protein SWK76_00340 [Actinomycetota bacterium]|nr:hypothetical protein [Actinomycetota bacterium]
MKKLAVDNNKTVLVPLVVLCVSLLAIIVFFVAPDLRETVTIVRKQGAHPDSWAYFAILGSHSAHLRTDISELSSQLN